MNKSLNLFLLQNADSKIDNALHRIKKIDDDISNTLLIKEAERQLTAKNELLFHSESKLKDLESRISTTRIKIQQSESSLYSGKIVNPKELQDLQTEISLLKKNIATLEEEQFISLLEVEENLHNKELSTESLSTARNQSETENSKLRAEKQNLEKEIETLQTERDALLKTIDPVVLTTYQKISLARKGIAVTQVIDNACEKCGAEITQDDWQKARISSELCFCSTCGRILYAK